MREVTPLTIGEDLKGKRILLRSSLNVPIKNGRVANAYRVRVSMATIRALAQSGARTVVCAHIGSTATDSLRAVYDYMRAEGSFPIAFSSSVIGKEAKEKTRALRDGEVVLLENIRRERGETENDPEFAKKLSEFGDLYVNDAFSDSHREHASIVGVPLLLSHYAGPNFIREISGITPARTPENPSLAIIGGVKFLTKEPLLRHLLSVYSHVFIGGAIAQDFFLARGISVGKSLVSGSHIPKDLATHPKLILPEDVMVENANESVEKDIREVGMNDTIVDVGPKTLIRLAPLAREARLILWNGPMGNFERGFAHGTERVAELIVASSGVSVVGGGDTIAAIERLGTQSDITHLSSAGGAMLQFIAEGTLPGIEALSAE